MYYQLYIVTIKQTVSDSYSYNYGDEYKAIRISGAVGILRQQLYSRLMITEWLRPLASQYLLIGLCNLQAYIKMLLGVTC